MELLKKRKVRQAEWRLKAGSSWEGCPLGDLVFTDELGRHLVPDTVYDNLKRVVRSIGLPETRLHDLRHPNVKPRTQTFSTFLNFLRMHFTLLLGTFPSRRLHTEVFHFPDNFHLIIRIDIHPVNQRVRQPSRQATGTDYLPRQFCPGIFRFFIHLHLRGLHF